MALVLGVDSSTQSTKVEVRDADTGELVGSGRASHPRRRRPQRAGPGEVVRGAGGGSPAGRDAGGRRDGRRWPAARDGRARRAARRCSGRRSSGTTPSRRPTPSWLRRQLGRRASRGRRRAARCRWRRSRSPSSSWLHRTSPRCSAAPGAGAAPARLADVPAQRRVRDRPRRRVGHRVLVAGRRARTRDDLLAVVDARRDWDAAVPDVLGPTEVAGAREGAVVGAGTGDNMAAALGVGLAAGRGRDLARHLGHGVHGQRRADRRPDGRRRRLRRRHRTLPAPRLHVERDAR